MTTMPTLRSDLATSLTRAQQSLKGLQLTQPASLTQGADQVRFSPTSLRFASSLPSLAQLFPTAAELPAEFEVSSFNAKKFLVNGEVRDYTGATTDVVSSIRIRDTENGQPVLKTKVIGQLPAMTSAEALEALSAAEKAYDKGLGQWPTSSPEQRIACMRKFIENMKPQRELVAKIEMHEVGKSYEDCLKEFDRTIEYIDKSIAAYEKMSATNETVVEIGGKIKKEKRTPKGIALCLGPYNYPLNETFAGGLISALLTGNPIICKLPRMGGMCNVPLFEAFQKSFPKGVVNFISGDGPTIVTPIMESGKIDILAFIGSEGAANKIIKAHPTPNRLSIVLGLGAKNPGIILKDADLDNAVKEAVAGSLSFNGQRCTALKQIFVHEDIAMAFAQKFTVEVNKLDIGMPYKKGVKITPLPTENEDVARMKALVQNAEDGGAVVLNKNQGGGTSDGTLYKPAVVFGVKPGMWLYEAEQFGPVVSISTFKDVEEVKQYCKNSPVGQQVSIFGKDPAVLNDLTQTFENLYCRTNINEQCQRSPDEFAFDGRKNSANGTLSITEAINRFTTSNMVTMKASEDNLRLLNQLKFRQFQQAT